MKIIQIPSTFVSEFNIVKGDYKKRKIVTFKVIEIIEFINYIN
jgi:hypothetical protein